MVVIGVTGMLGTGKSTVARRLARRGASVIDADRLAHEVMRPGTLVARRLARRFPGAVRPDGTVDRRALAQQGFASRRAWQDLCRIVHPAVIAETRRRLRAIRRRDRSAVVVLDVPLLIESGMTRLVDWVVVVAAPPRVARRWPAAEIRRRLRWQMPLAQKVRRADVVINNRGSRRAMEQQVEQFWSQLHHQERNHG